MRDTLIYCQWTTGQLFCTPLIALVGAADQSQSSPQKDHEHKG